MIPGLRPLAMEVAGERAAEWTMENLREVREELRNLKQGEPHPRKKTKTVVLREGLFKVVGKYYTQWCNEEYIKGNGYFLKWLDTPELMIEVEE